MKLSSLASHLAAAPPRTRALLVAGAGAAALLLSASGDPLLATAGRASLAAVALAALAWGVRRNPSKASPRPLIDVRERRSLSREAAVALVHVRGRALLLGYGADGVQLLADFGAADAGEAP